MDVTSRHVALSLASVHLGETMRFFEVADLNPLQNQVLSLTFQYCLCDVFCLGSPHCNVVTNYSKYREVLT